MVVWIETTVFYLYKDNKTLRGFIDAIQEKRVAEAQQTNDRLIGPIEENNRTNKQIYELLQIINNRREQ